MIENAVNLLLLALIIAAIIQPVLRLRVVGALFAGGAVIHDWLGFSGLSYFASAALVNLLCLIVASSIRPLDNRVLNLGRLAFAMILLNFLGAVFYTVGVSYLFYSVPFIFLYVAVFFIVALPRLGSSYGHTVVDDRVYFCVDRYAWHRMLSPIRKGAP